MTAVFRKNVLPYAARWTIDESDTQLHDELADRRSHTSADDAGETRISNKLARNASTMPTTMLPASQRPRHLTICPASQPAAAPMFARRANPPCSSLTVTMCSKRRHGRCRALAQTPDRQQHAREAGDPAILEAAARGARAGRWPVETATHATSIPRSTSALAANSATHHAAAARYHSTPC